MQRSFVTLLTAAIFLVLAVTGILAFVREFSLQIIGLHALMGFMFVVIVGFHALNNFKPFKEYLCSNMLWVAFAITAIFTTVIFLQPQPIQFLLQFSANLGPAIDQFEMNPQGMVYRYSPAEHYKMALTIKAGKSYDETNPPHVAIWLENQGAYHIKTLYHSGPLRAKQLPYWSFKLKGWEKAKQEAETGKKVDGVSSATPNGSFDPTDYILPADPNNPMPYKLLIEINQPGDAHGSIEDQPSLIYSVEIDNLHPQSFQLLELVGYPKSEMRAGKEKWDLYYVDDQIDSAVDLIDSVLLTIERSEP